MNILISGAGITGNALAFWLSKLGHKVTIVERAPSLRASDLQINLRSHGVKFSDRWALNRAKSIPEQGMQMVDKTGKRRAYFSANDSAKMTFGFSTSYEIMSHHVRRRQDSNKYVFGTSIESFEEKEDEVGVRFTNGTMDQFDLLAGTDGQGSRTRRMMLGDGAPDAFKPLRALYVSYFTIPDQSKWERNMSLQHIWLPASGAS